MGKLTIEFETITPPIAYGLDLTGSDMEEVFDFDFNFASSTRSKSLDEKFGILYGDIIMSFISILASQIYAASDASARVIKTEMLPDFDMGNTLRKVTAHFYIPDYDFSNIGELTLDEETTKSLLKIVKTSYDPEEIDSAEIFKKLENSAVITNFESDAFGRPKRTILIDTQCLLDLRSGERKTIQRNQEACATLMREVDLMKTFRGSNSLNISESNRRVLELKGKLKFFTGATNVPHLKIERKVKKGFKPFRASNLVSPIIGVPSYLSRGKKGEREVDEGLDMISATFKKGL